MKNNEKLNNIAQQIQEANCLSLESTSISTQECNKLLKDAKKYSELKLIQSVVIPDSIEVIGRFAFSRNNLTELKLGKNVREIETRAFAENNLQKLLLHSNTKKLNIWEYAFYYNDLESIEMPYSVTYNKNKSSFDDWTEIYFQ